MSEENNKQEFILSEEISDLENYNADSVLTDGLKEIYAQVQLDCDDFRNNIFFKFVDYLDERIGDFDREPPVLKKDDNLLKKIQSPEERYRYYAQRASQIS